MSTNVSPLGSSSSQPAIRFSGLGSGLDTNGIITALMKIERQPIDRINAEKAAASTKKGVVQEINGLLGKLRDAAAALYAPDALAAKTATAADTSIVSASATSSAAAGSYNVTVTSLAQAHTLASTAGPTLTAGQTLTLSAGAAAPVSVSVQAGDDLQKLADRINATSGTPVSASVISNRLVLISTQSGSAGAITVGGSAAPSLGLSTTQAATDAAATVNGLSVTSSGNQITGAINGVTLSLGKLGSTTVTVAADQTQNLQKVQAFVSAYNDLIGNVNRATAYDAATKTAGTLQGDQTITSLASQVRRIAGSAVQGLTGAYDSLAAIGITSARDGTLSVDQAKFTAAMTANPDAVRKVFAVDDGVAGVGPADGVARQIQAFADGFSSNILSARLSGYTTSMQRMDDRIASLQNIMDLKEKTLRAQFTAMETAVSQFQSQGASIAAKLASL